MTPRNPSVTEVPRLGPHELDQVAAEAAVPIAAAFAAAGWTWGALNPNGETFTPNAAQIALTIRGLLDDVELDHNRSTGRLSVVRYIEDGREIAEVSLSPVADVCGREAANVT